MPEKKDEPAWSDQADAVYMATIASIDEIESYNVRMNLLLNLVRYCTMTQVGLDFQRATNRYDASVVFIETGMLTSAMQNLVDELCIELKKMPRRMLAVMHAEKGCGGCSACKAAQEEAYGDGKVRWRPSREAKEAIDNIINTITGGKPRNPDN